MAETPFDSIESAQSYLRLLAAEVEAVRSEIQKDTDEATRDAAVRRLDALHIVDYKLKQLAQQLDASCRILNDLRLLRRLLAGDRNAIAVDAAASSAIGPLPHL
jgi:hypothetical protein